MAAEHQVKETSHHHKLTKMLHDHKKDIEHDLFDHREASHEPQYHHMHRDFDSHRFTREPQFDHMDRDFDFRGVPDFGYDTYEGHAGYENAMTTRTFPKLKPHKYDPDAMAKELEKARSLGNMPQKEEEIPLHKDSHRR